MSESKIPELVEFDQKLLDKWFELPAVDDLNISVPRIAFDMLYDGVQQGYMAQIDMVTALQNLALGKEHDVGKFNEEIVPKIIAGWNSIRRFQTVVMMRATGAHLDDDGKVIDD